MCFKNLAIIGAMLLASHAYGIECVELKENNNIELEIKKNENFDNCFSLSDLPANTAIQLILFSKDNVRSKTVLYNLAEHGAGSYISEYISDSNGASIIHSNTTNRKIGFKITPTSNITTNKDLNITYIKIPEGAQIIAQIFDVKSETQVEPELPPGGGCYERQGQVICYEER